MLVATDHVTSATMPGKKPYPNTLPEKRDGEPDCADERDGSDPAREDAAAQRHQSAAARNPANPIAATRNGPTSPVAIALLTTGFA
jgi:hypothetical protein